MKRQERTYLKVTLKDVGTAANTDYSTNYFGAGVPGAVDPRGGFIDPIQVWQTEDFDAFGSYVADSRAAGVVGVPTNGNLTSFRKSRGQLRWKQLGKNLADQGGLCFFGNVHLKYTSSITPWDTPTTGEVVNFWPLEIEFVVGYDRWDSMIVHNYEHCSLDGGTTPGPDYFTDTDAIVRLLQRTFIYPYFTGTDVFVTVDNAGSPDVEYRNNTQALDVLADAPADSKTGGPLVPDDIVTRVTQCDYTIGSVGATNISVETDGFAIGEGFTLSEYLTTYNI